MYPPRPRRRAVRQCAALRLTSQCRPGAAAGDDYRKPIKDVETVRGQPARPARWVRLVRLPTGTRKEERQKRTDRRHTFLRLRLGGHAILCAVL
jgi:hypothetical protein